ncbi:MAG TPA: hypothetical protein VER03_12620 [Bryobacteraceae bacterium]|nr:hypothetical protein [Bryobacteraceae bacterium]
MTSIERFGWTATALAAVLALGAGHITGFQSDGPGEPLAPNDAQIRDYAAKQVRDGREIFRHDTFGSESFWGGALRLHEFIAGSAIGGVGAGLSPKAALGLGLKVDAAAVPQEIVSGLQAGTVNLDDPATTLALLKLNAVVGVKGFFSADGKLRSVGIQCSLCHSTVDNSFSTAAIPPGNIGRRLDGWPARDLNVGAIIAAAPSLKPFADLLGVSEAEVRRVLMSWGPGKFDAELLLDGKAFRPDGKSAATLLPAAFGLAGVNLHTYTGWGGISHWNAFVATLEMGGSGTVWEPRLNDAVKFPIAARNGFAERRPANDLVTSKLAALQAYQLAIPAPAMPRHPFARSIKPGEELFNGKAKCGTCHVAPLYTEPGWNMHLPSEIGIDSFQADRSPDGRYRTTPLKGMVARQKGGFYHDGRFATLRDVVEHYNSFLRLNLTEAEKEDLVEFVRSL